MTCSPARLSSDPVGSSAKTTAGSMTSARAIATRWAWPPDISPARRCSSPSSPSRGNQRAASCSASPRPIAVEEERQRDVLDRRELRDELAELEDEAERGPAQPAALGVAHRVDPAAHRSRRGRRPGTAIPARQWSSVDLPEPLGPMTATISPAASAKSMPRSASVCPNRLWRSVPSRRATRRRAPSRDAAWSGRAGMRLDHGTSGVSRMVRRSSSTRAAVRSSQRRSASRWKRA